MEDLSQLAGTASKYKTGGLGRLMVEGVFEAWVCLAGHECSARHDEVRCRWDLLRCSEMLRDLCSCGICHNPL